MAAPSSAAAPPSAAPAAPPSAAPAASPAILSAALFIAAAAVVMVSAAACMPSASTSTFAPVSQDHAFASAPAILNPRLMIPVFFRISSAAASPARVSRTGFGSALTNPAMPWTIATMAPAVAMVNA